MPVPVRLAMAIVSGAVAIAVVVSLAIWSDRPGDPPVPPDVRVRAAAAPVETISANGVQSAVGVSRRLFTSSPAVVLAASTDPQARATGIAVAAALRVPVLIDSSAAPAEIERLGARIVLTVGPTRAVAHARRLPLDPDTAVSAVAAMNLPGAHGTIDTLVVVRSRTEHAAAAANAESAGATVVEIETGDPRRSPAASKALVTRRTSPVLAIDVPRDFAYTLDVTRRGAEQPTGDFFALPGRHYVALYGHPGAPSLGVLGEQGVAASVKRVEQVTAKYRALSKKSEFVPTFEIIATVAAAGAGKDKNYSNEVPVSRLTPLVDAAEKAGVYVILDLQPGRTDFLTQAKRYRDLLARPHVGLALDPEWRLTTKQKHLEQIGSVDAAEINRTSAWLAALTRQNSLPQKLFVVHQFTGSMIKHRSRLDTSHAELATVIHVDGSGSQTAKNGTWRHLREKAPSGLAGWGWKNFVDEDAPMLTSRQTWARVRPHPALITYQ